MSDLISRRTLEDAMYHEAFETDSDMQRWDSGCWIRYILFENVLEKQPAVNPESERKKGTWVNCGWSTCCSVCGYDMPWAVRNYCPCCGAKMKDEGKGD